MIAACVLFIGFDLIGEWIQRRSGLPIPGPLIGLVLLTTCLCVRPQFSTRGMRSGSRLLVGSMSMFFVPAGTGVITQLRQIRLQWIPISAALCVSTIASLLVTAWMMRLLDGVLTRRFSPASAPEGLE